MQIFFRNEGCQSCFSLWHIFSEIIRIKEQEKHLSVFKEDICLYVNSFKCSQNGSY